MPRLRLAVCRRPVAAARTIVLALAGLLAPPAAGAADEVQDDIPDYANETLTGDWAGRRTAMSEAGINLDIGYVVDMLRNTRGGLAKGGRPITHLDFKLKADFGKLVGWRGGSGYANFIHDAGGKLNVRQVGSLLGTSNIEVADNTHRFLHAWLQQEFADGQGALLAGIYPLDSEFQVVDAASVFVAPPYGATAELALTRGPSIFNTAAFGLRAKWLTKNRAAYVQGAVLDGIPGDPARQRGTHVSFDKGDGIMSIVEVGLTPPEAGHAFEPAATVRGEPLSAEMKAHEFVERIEKYALGIWRYSARVDDLVDVDAAGSPLRRRSWGWYALAERTFYRGSGSSDLVGFARLSTTDGDSTAIRRTLNLGLRARGIIAGRERDIAGIAYTRALLGDKFRRLQAAAGSETTAYEDAWELTYRIQATRWLAVQPLLQRIGHPGGDKSRAAAHIVGARIDLAF